MNLRILLPLLALVIFISCGKDDEAHQAENLVSFNVNSLASNSGRVSQEGLESAKYVLVTIEKVDGSPTDHTLKKLELYSTNGEFISEKISLPVGDYQVVEFFVLDTENNITHITPLEDSEQARNVTDPLPIEFSVSTNQITSIDVEVISSESLPLDDFGLGGFNLSQIDLFNFLVVVSEQGTLNHILEGTITVESGDYNFSKELLAIANNSVIIKDGYPSYQLTVEKDGYLPFNYTFTRDSLAYYQSIPLSIELVAGSNLTVQERLDNGESPFEIINSGITIDELYGKKYAGGLIFYLNLSDETGLVCAENDQSTNTPWFSNDIIVGANGEEIGTGASNTEITVNVLGGDLNEYAAGVAKSYQGAGYTDWFLPSLNEFIELHNNLHRNSLGNLANERYWTSSERFQGNPIQSNSAIVFGNYSNWNAYGFTLKSLQYRVRAVRSF